jgi:hypothetical protein
LSKIFTRLLPLLLVFLFYSDSAGAQQSDHAPNLYFGDAVAAGFFGTLAPDPTKPRAAKKSVIDLTFINADGRSARIVSVGRPGHVRDGRLLPAPKTLDLLAKDVSQVFGIAADDETPPNSYLAATSAFGLQLVRRGRDCLPERGKIGGPGNRKMSVNLSADQRMS